MKISVGRWAIFAGALLLLVVIVALLVSRPPSIEAPSALVPRGDANVADMEKSTRRQPDGRPGAGDAAQGSAAGLNAAAGGVANPAAAERKRQSNAAEGADGPGKRAQASPKPALPLPDQVSPYKVASTFGDIANRSQEATNKLDEFARADPERYTDVRLKYAAAAEAVVPIALAQALEDPVLRPLLLEKLKDEKYFVQMRHMFAQGTEGGYLNFASAKSPLELANLIRRVEPEYNRRFSEIVKSANFPEEVQSNLADSIGAGYLKSEVGEYMRKNGYEFNPVQRTFQTSSSGDKPDLRQGTYFRLPWRP